MDGTNGYNRELVENLLREVDRCDDELASLKGEYMQECKGPREEIDEIKSRAKEAGVPTRVFSTLIKNRRLDKQAQNNVSKLEADDMDTYDRICTDLGDFVNLPLGQAALQRARPNEQHESALDSVV